MNRYGRKVRRYHKKRNSAKEQLKKFERGQLKFDAISRIAKNLFYKRLKAGYALPAKMAAAT